jgi:hypothetical protein
MTQTSQIFTDTLNFPGGIQPADMIAGKENCRGFMVAVAVLVVLLTLLLFFAWSRKRSNPKPEPPLHTATLGSKNSDRWLTYEATLLATARLTGVRLPKPLALVARNEGRWVVLR